jgi:hypothetical protein
VVEFRGHNTERRVGRTSIRYCVPGIHTQDPSALEAGPSVLLLDRDWLERELAARDLAVFWTVAGEKLLLGGTDTYTHNHPGRLVLSGYAYMQDSEVRSEQRA